LMFNNSDFQEHMRSIWASLRVGLEARK
jgi:hypothetical protein